MHIHLKSRPGFSAAHLKITGNINEQGRAQYSGWLKTGYAFDPKIFTKLPSLAMIFQNMVYLIFIISTIIQFPKVAGHHVGIVLHGGQELFG